MIKLISREEIYYKSSLVDHLISELQQEGKRDHSYSINYLKQVIIPGEDPFDHLEPFHDRVEVLDDFAVLGYFDKSKPDFLTHRSNAFIHFLGLIGARQLYLMDDLKIDWVKFPFKSAEKREAMKRIVNQSAYSDAFILDIDELLNILPLFNFSDRHSVPIFWLITVDIQVPLVMFLCDDGNFHTSFFQKDRERISSAASAAGLKMGGLEICRI